MRRRRAGCARAREIADVEFWSTPTVARTCSPATSAIPPRSDGCCSGERPSRGVAWCSSPRVKRRADRRRTTGPGRRVVRTARHALHAVGRVRFSISARCRVSVGTFAARRFSTRNPLIGEPDGYPIEYPVGVELSGSGARFDYRVARGLAPRFFTPDTCRIERGASSGHRRGVHRRSSGCASAGRRRGARTSMHRSRRHCSTGGRGALSAAHRRARRRIQSRLPRSARRVGRTDLTMSPGSPTPSRARRGYIEGKYAPRPSRVRRGARGAQRLSVHPAGGDNCMERSRDGLRRRRSRDWVSRVRVVADQGSPTAQTNGT